MRMSVPPESVIPPPPNEPPMAGAPSAEERQWAMFAHLSALVGVIIPLGSIIGPLVIWLIKKDTMPFVNDQGKEALNFNITVGIAAIVCWILCFILIGFLLAGVRDHRHDQGKRGHHLPLPVHAAAGQLKQCFA
jgi:uncharacterized protein